jgi:outer membrane protein
MYRFETAALLALLSVCLAGCATSALDMAPDSPDRPWTPRTTATGEIIPGSKIPSAESSASSYVLPTNLDAAVLLPALAIDKRRAYTLPELIDIAESNNPTTKIAWNAARNVALAKGIAESTFLPRLSASAIAGAQISNGQSTVQGLGLGSDQNDLHGTISVISLEWLLFDFGERSAIVEAAKQASVISNIAFTAAHQQVIYEVSTAFYADAAARARLRTASQSLKNAESVQVAADDRYTRGVGTVVEVAQARQGSAQARLALVQADGAAKDSYLRLISAIGISPLTQMRVADTSGRRLSKPMYGSVAQTIQLAMARRPDVLSAYAAQKASLANIDAARAAFMPKAFVSGNGGYTTGNLDVTSIPSVGQQLPTVNIAGQHANATILAGVTVPLYDGGTRLASLKQAEDNAENAKLALVRTQNEAVRQIALADNALRTGLSSYTASTTLAAAAQTTFDSALAAYRNGIGSITDATVSESQLLQANNARTDAYSTALSAAATLALAVGALGEAPK